VPLTILTIKPDTHCLLAQYIAGEFISDACACSSPNPPSHVISQAEIECTYTTTSIATTGSSFPNLISEHLQHFFAIQCPWQMRIVYGSGSDSPAPPVLTESHSSNATKELPSQGDCQPKLNASQIPVSHKIE
jgi:hypothetical protein